MIEVKQKGTFRWKVKVEWPEDEGFVEHEIVCVFNRLTSDQITDPVKDEVSDEDDPLKLTERLRKLILGTRTIQEKIIRAALVEIPEGLKIPEGSDIHDVVLAHPALANAIETEFYAAIRGGAREKN